MIVIFKFLHLTHGMCSAMFGDGRAETQKVIVCILNKSLSLGLPLPAERSRKQVCHASLRVTWLNNYS